MGKKQLLRRNYDVFLFLAALLPVLRRFAQSYAALGPAAKKTIEALLPELAALLEAAEGAMQ